MSKRKYYHQKEQLRKEKGKNKGSRRNDGQTVGAEDVVAFMSQPDYSPLRARPLGRALGVTDEDMDGFLRELARLEKSGIVKLAAGRNYMLGKTAPIHLVIGKILVKDGGFGFVAVEGQEDVFVPPGDLGGAITGDVVQVSLSEDKGRNRKGPSGKVIRVVERGTSALTGIFYPMHGKGGYVLADNPGLSDGIDIPGDKTGNARNGDKVRVEVLTWPEGNHPAKGAIIEVFGQAGDWQAELAAIVSEFGLRTRFPDSVIATADSYGQEDIDAEKKHRRDFRNLLTVTIDPVDAKDFDDAVSLEEHAAGWTLYVHIADVAHFVRDGDTVDKEARLRSTSVYLPGQVIPMLPPNLTRDICCLREGVDRLAMTAIMEYDKESRRKSFYITPSVIRSSKRLNYGEVKRALDAGDPSVFPQGVYELLSKMKHYSQILREERTQLGSINLDLPEPHILFGEDGRITEITLEENDFSHQMIEEFMLSANRCVAEYLARWNLPALYRIHDEPEIDSMKRFADFAVQYGITLKSPYTRKKLQDIVDKVLDKPYAHAVQMMMLRSMKRAVYSDILKAHYALGFSHYLHFTSPIRRYPDLFVHRVLHEIAAQTKPPLTVKTPPVRSGKLEIIAESGLRHLAEHCSLQERAAAESEERLTRFRQIEFLRERMSGVWDGVITAVTREGLIVELQGVWVTGLLPMTKFGRDGFHYHQETKKLTGRNTGKTFCLGDKIKVHVKRADLVSQEIDLEMAKGKEPNVPGREPSHLGRETKPDAPKPARNPSHNPAKPWRNR
jgi:ribonuclease R